MTPAPTRCTLRWVELVALALTHPHTMVHTCRGRWPHTVSGHECWQLFKLLTNSRPGPTASVLLPSSFLAEWFRRVAGSCGNEWVDGGNGVKEGEGLSPLQEAVLALLVPAAAAARCWPSVRPWQMQQD